MKIAIIGAGLAGVSLAWHLISSGSCEVAVFDHNGVAGGASSIASGLMHPYPGELGRRSFMATEGMGATRQLLTIAQAKSSHPITAHPGIIRFMQNPEQHELFLTHEKEFGDVELYQKDAFLISSGMTIFCQRYLDGLWSAAAERGALLERKEIKDLQELSSYDQIIIAAGAGLKLFPEAQGIHVSFLKGQILTCAIPEHVEFPQQSIIGKGYIAHAEDPRCCYVGSTYERGQLSALPDREVAMAHILLKIAAFYPAITSFPVIDCRAAFRVMRIGHYYPMVGRLKDNIWVCTALGSRGLLYHALVGELLTEAVLSDEPSKLPLEFNLPLI